MLPAVNTTTKPSPETEPLAEATLAANTAEKLSADSIGLTAEFSGYEIDGDLDIRIAAAPEAAALSAASETEGQVIGAAVEITAETSDHTEVTKFPAEVQTVTDDHGVESAIDVTPGITLGFDVDAAAVEEAGLDLASLKIYTREAEGGPWLELPSYFDTGSGKVVGESDHLSQFVVIGKKFIPPPGPRIVLDPDDDYGWAQTPAPASELPYNVALSNLAAAKLSQACLAPVVVTRQADVRFVSGETRAAIAASFNPVITVTVAFDAVSGSAWGTESNGGTYLYSRGGAGDTLAASLVNTMPTYTGRPAGTRAANAIFPDPAFSGVPGAMAHMETLYLDHNYDRAVIDNGFEHVVNGAVVGIARYAESLGFNCTDPVRGGLPGPPPKAELERWRHLGHQNYQTYGADPVSFSTGNLVEDEELFTLSGRGNQELDFTLTYNSQDGRLSRIGAGWSFGLGGRAQRFDDGSVLVVRGDGASFAFTPDGAGGYTGEDGPGLTLRDVGAGTLELRSDTGEIWRYDAADIEGIGELISHTDRQGQTTRIGYGAANEDVHQFVPLTTITDAAGQTVTVENDAVGRITAFVHPDGRRWQLAYDAAGNLVSITNPDGGVRSFTYDGEYRMLTATDALGTLYLKNEYDSAGRVVKQWDADGNLRTFEYSDGTTKYTNAEGDVSTFTWDQGKRITRIQDAAGGDTKLSYDKQGRTTKSESPEGTVSYSYDKYGNVTSETLPDGNVWKYTWTASGELLSETDPLGRTTTHTVDGQGLTTSTIRPDGSVLKYTYTEGGDLATVTHPSGAIERFSYDDRGNLTEHSSPAGRITRYAYDAANRMVSSTDPAGSVTTYGYDAGDRMVSSIDPLGRVTSYTYNANGQPLTETAPDGGITTFTWDTGTRLATVTDPEGGVTAYIYNTEDAVTSITDPLGGATKYRVDPMGRATQVTDPLGGVWDVTLDQAGRATKHTDPEGRANKTGYDELGQVVSETDGEGGTWEYVYDAVGNLTEATDPEGGKATYTYDDLDRLIETVDPDGRVTSTEYDADGHQIAIIDPVGGTTGYTVDADGVILTVTNALGNTTTVEHDAAGNITAQIDPLGNRIELEYDAAGQLVLSRDANGGETRFEYDAAGRQSTITDPAGNRTEQRYDKAGRTVATVDASGDTTQYAYDKAGRQISTTDPEGRQVRYSYDDAGQLVKVVEGDTELSGTTQYAYTKAGELASITDPRGGVSSYEYDRAGRLTTRKDAAGVVSNTGYDKIGRVVSERNGAGQSRGYTYSKGGLITESSSPTGTTSYEYDGAGRPVVMRDPEGVTAWKYDKLGQVLSETSAQNRATKASYDAAGQVTRMTLPDGQKIDYQYDKLGQVTSQETPWGDLAYAWRADGVLASIQRGDGVTTTIVSDAEQRPTSILHAEPATTPVKPEPTPEVSIPKRKPAVCPAGGTASYLEDRTLPNLEGEDEQCVKTADYLKRRTLPAPTDPVNAGGALRYDYSYTPAGNTATTVRDILGPLPDAGDEAQAPGAEPVRPVIESRTSAYSYDVLGRLSESTTTDTTPVAVKPEPGGKPQPGNKAPDPTVLSGTVFGYDENGNRTLAETTTPNGVTTVQQEFGDGNRLTRQTVTGGTNPGTREYAYDRAGRRTSERGAGLPDADYGYGWGGNPTSIRTGDRTTTIDYDGFGRPTTQQVSTRYGTDSVSQTFFGGKQTDRVSSQHGTSLSLWDAAGNVAGITTDTDDEARWALLDGLTSVVAEATGPAGADISQLASYSEYGVPSFESTGYAQPRGYTGQIQDGATGITSFATRAYDPNSGTWLAPDAWPGLLVAPATLNGYAYVLGNPTTFMDENGYWPKLPNFASLATRIVKAVVSVVSKVASFVSSAARSAVRVATGVLRAKNAIVSRGVSLAGGLVSAGRQARQAAGAIAASGSFMMARHVEATRRCFAGPVHIAACAITSHRTNTTTAGILTNWALGNPRDAQLGPNATFTRLIRGHSSTDRYRSNIIETLKAGGSLADTPSGGYQADSFSPTNPNLIRDVSTVLTWPVAGSQAKMLVTLGTYDLNAQVVEQTPGARSAKVRFTATNDTTLGSLLRTGIPGMYEALNNWAGEDGPFSRYGQTFTWEETITW